LTEHERERKWKANPDRELTGEESEFYGTAGSERGRPEESRVRDPHRDDAVRAEPARDETVEEGYEASGAAAPASPREGTRAETEPSGTTVDRGEHTRHGGAGAPAGSPARTGAVEEGREAATTADNVLFRTEEAESLRGRWDAIQTEFVDEPRTAVEKADNLVGDVMRRLTEGFSQERTRLEAEWSRGESVSTEDLRVALKRYRSFFDRLLSV
jgi:hypothetical protein